MTALAVYFGCLQLPVAGADMKTVTAGNKWPRPSPEECYGSDVTFCVFFRRAPPRMPVSP